MTDNNPSSEGIADARPLDQDQADNDLIARFLEDETVDDDATVPEGKPEEKATEQSPKSDDEDDVLFAEEDDAKTDGDKDKAEPQLEVTLSDGTKVTPAQIQEWRDGSLRQADYTRKTQEIAEQRQEIEAERARIKAHETDVSQALDRALAVLSAYVPQEPSLELAATDPLAYTQQKAIYDASMQRVAQLVSEKNALEQKTKAQSEHETKAERQKRLMAEREALNAHFPHLKDPKKEAAFVSQINETAKAYGFPDGIAGQIEDHRMFRVLADAARYRALQARKTEAPKAAPVAAAPVRRGVQGDGFRDAVKRAQQSQNPDALMETLAARFND